MPASEAFPAGDGEVTPRVVHLSRVANEDGVTTDVWAMSRISPGQEPERLDEAAALRSVYAYCTKGAAHAGTDSIPLAESCPTCRRGRSMRNGRLTRRLSQSPSTCPQARSRVRRTRTGLFARAELNFAAVGCLIYIRPNLTTKIRLLSFDGKAQDVFKLVEDAEAAVGVALHRRVFELPGILEERTRRSVPSQMTSSSNATATR